MYIPKTFFGQEERCGFMISEMMKRAWAATMEVMEVLDHICQKNNIKYFADWGTLLGAVRHKGFIPWDDDMDFSLLRTDYNRLIQVLPSELPDGFVMAGMYSASKRLQDACDVGQIRVIADEEYWDFPNYLARFHAFPYPRIGIDIFPLDYISDDTEFAQLQSELIYEALDLLTNWEQKKQNAKAFEQQLTNLEKLCNVTLMRDDTLKNQLWQLSDRLCALATEEESSNVTNYSSFFLEKKYHLHKYWLTQTIQLPFEHITLPVPKNYHEVLTVEYGDYMTPVKMCAAHDYPFYSTQEDALQELFRNAGITKSVDEFCRNWESISEQLNQ